jgi:hypothetical protein
MTTPLRKLRVKLSTSFPGWPVQQQTPGGRAVWEGVEFLINQPVEECDAWFVYDGIPIKDTTICPQGCVVLVTSEPSTFKRYNSAWMRGFDHVITSQHGLRHPSVTYTQTGLPWLIHKTYDELRLMPLPEKTGLISVISSTKATTRGHRQRLRFVRELMRETPVQVFGRGFHPLDDKWDGLAPFRFSIAIENSCHTHYWTEKFSDCVLAGTIPLYHGCPNVNDYFPAGASISLDITNGPAAIQQVKSLLERAEDEYKSRLFALAEARRLVLDEHNLFNLIAGAVAVMNTRLPRQVRTVCPEPKPGWLQKRWGKLISCFR